MAELAMRWRKFFSKGRDQADEAIRLSRELREAAAELVEKHYAQLDGEEQWWVDNSQKDRLRCECKK